MEVSPVILLALVAVSLISLAGVVYPFKPFKKRWVALASFLGCFALVSISALAPVSDQSNEEDAERVERGKQYWVTAERLNRRTCPSEECGVVGQLFYREAITVHEEQNGWARVSDYYDAACAGGLSEYVDTGNAACVPSNGINDKRFAEWVSATFISEKRPADPADGAQGFEALVAGSDDFARYRDAFADAAQKLIDQGRCSKSDFQNMGGWVKSTQHGDQPIYFTYCDASDTINRFYLNAKSGQILQ